MPEIAEKLSIVEEALAHFIYKTESSLRQLSREMSDFKDEMKEFKDEMKEFKDEMKEFKDEMYQDRKNMNKQWGDLANRLGTIVEDIVAPAVVPAIRKYFGQEPLLKMIHCQKHLKKIGLKGEFDVVVVTETSVFVVETKSYPDRSKVMNFKDKTLPKFRELFPEYAGLTLMPIFSSLCFEPDLVDAATQESIYLLAYREWDYMDILNFEEINKSSDK